MRCKLGNIIKINQYTYTSHDQWKYVNYLDTGNITKNVIDTVQYIDLSKETLPSRARRKVKNGSILYSMVRPNQSHYGIIKDGIENFLVSTGFAVIDVDTNKACPAFIYYMLTQQETTERLQAIAEQSVSAYPSIKPSDIENLDILLPNLLQQQKITKLLGSLDDKIELNRQINSNLLLLFLLLFILVQLFFWQINSNLEQQAQAIFKEMFIDNGLKNVKKGMLQDIAEITMGLSPDGSSYNEKQLGIIFFQGRAEFSDRFPKIRLYTSQPKRMAMRNDILMSVRAPVGDINIAHHDCCIGRGLASIRSKYNHQSFLFYTMLNLKKYLDRFNSEGTVFGAISKDALNTIPIDIPSEGKIKHFEQIASPIDTCILNNYKEICCLESLRDTLLPKLMSGEIDVSKIELD